MKRHLFIVLFTLLHEIDLRKPLAAVLLFVSLFTFDVSHAYSQQPTQEWVQRYTGYGYASGLSVKLDSAGNVYVLTHQSGPAFGSYYGLLKYSPSGNLIWNVIYNFDSTTDGNVPKAFDVTTSGNVYITGNGGTVSSNSIVTVKFNNNGVLQWARVIPNADAYDIKVDRDGNVVVGGDDGSLSDAYIVKYNPNGDTLFARKFNNASLNNILLDDSNNIYGCGSFGAHYLIFKYSAQGTFMWYAIWSSGIPNYQDFIDAAAIDTNRNLYVVGSTYRSFSGGLFSNTLVKVNSVGNVQWASTFNGIIPGDTSCEFPGGIDVTPDGSAIYYVTECANTQGNGEIVTLRYDSNGDSVWVRRYSQGATGGVPTTSPALKLDRYGNVYFTGYAIFPTSGTNISTVKYLASGVTDWTVNFSTFQGGANDLYIDTSLSIYVTGITGTSNALATTIKYDQPNGIQKISSVVPKGYSLGQNYPNPFNSSTIIHYEVLRKSNIKVSVYNTIGQLVRSLVNNEQQAGRYRIELDASDLATGVYFYILYADNIKIDCKKFVLLK